VVVEVEVEVGKVVVVVDLVVLVRDGHEKVEKDPNHHNRRRCHRCTTALLHVPPDDNVLED
jgi:hypothetical protein